MPTTIIGLDLAGPANAADTAVVVATATDDALTIDEARIGLSDTAILALGRRLGPGPCVFALDAPLSYNDGGGDRPGDKQLRHRIIKEGLASGSVMPPTMTRMAYLTLRGLAVARGIGSLGRANARIVEVHPGAAMRLRGAPLDAVRGYGTQPAARAQLLQWLGTQRIAGLEPRMAETSHQLAAIGAALAGWGWARGEPAWCWAASPPLHPFDFAC